MVNLKKVKMPSSYPFPPHIAERPRDFKLAWFLLQETGIAAIPVSGKPKPSASAVSGFRKICSVANVFQEFYINERAWLVENFLRFSVARTDDRIGAARERLRGLRRYL